MSGCLTCIKRPKNWNTVLSSKLHLAYGIQITSAFHEKIKWLHNRSYEGTEVEALLNCKWFQNLLPVQKVG